MMMTIVIFLYCGLCSGCTLLIRGCFAAFRIFGIWGLMAVGILLVGFVGAVVLFVS
jgi:hypothetical protein